MAVGGLAFGLRCWVRKPQSHNGTIGLVLAMLFFAVVKNLKRNQVSDNWRALETVTHHPGDPWTPGTCSGTCLKATCVL